MPTTQTEPAQDITSRQTSSVVGSVSLRRRKGWRFWSGVCFAVVLLAIFAGPLLSLVRYAATSDLHSYILLVPFVSVYLLYVRRHQLPKTYASAVPLGVLFLVAGIAAFAVTHSLDLLGRALSCSVPRSPLAVIVVIVAADYSGYCLYSLLWCLPACSCT